MNKKNILGGFWVMEFRKNNANSILQRNYNIDFSICRDY